jgi:gamma-butyrobetaine dioxygenase
LTEEVACAAVLVTPDFALHDWHPIAAATLSGAVVSITWDDGTRFDAFAPWLFEQSVGIEPITREGTIEPSAVPPDCCATHVTLDAHGALVVGWSDGGRSTIHPGWLHGIATDRHLPRAALGEVDVWTAADFSEPPTFDGARVLDDDAEFEAWLVSLCTVGIGRLRGTPTTDGFLGELAARIGPIRGSNFGGVFTVQSVVDPDSTANTGLALGQHTDLPTRETPPGFQFLHCIENSVGGGRSRMADGLAVVAELEAKHPEAYHSLTTDEWVFANRATDADHRWVGPIIDRGGLRSPLTIRAFYPVRLAPLMPIARQSAAYEAMRVFSAVAHDPQFMITSRFEPGDLVGFDNRRILHGRDAFDPDAGVRRLRGCYIDHDDLHSRLRVLRRPRAVQPARLDPPDHPPTESESLP